MRGEKQLRNYEVVSDELLTKKKKKKKKQKIKKTKQVLMINIRVEVRSKKDNNHTNLMV